MKRKTIIPYDSKLKDLARQLRKNSTLSEVLLWNHLKGKQMLGYDFDRQKPIDKYIVDFFCNELMLAIEIDGDTHNYKIDKDEFRQKKLEGLGVKFLRFTDEDVKKDIEGVVMTIEGWIRRNPPLQPLHPPLHPSREGTNPPAPTHPILQPLHPPLRPSREGI
jgi:very-short-patch-repair endonuclease